MATQKAPEPSFGIEAVARNRYPTRVLFQKVLECVHGRISDQSLSRANSLAYDLGITSGTLDRKLRHSSGLRTYVTNLLQELVDLASKRSLTSASHRSRPKYPDRVSDADLEAQLEIVLRTLATFSSTLMDPTPSDDIGRLSQAVRKDEYTQFDVECVQRKFPQCSTKLHQRVGALNRLRRLRSQDAQRAFERTVTMAWERKRVENEGTIDLSGDFQHPRLLDDDRVPLSEILADFEASTGDSEASSITSSSGSSGYGSWIPRSDDTDDVGIMKPQFVLADYQPLSIPEKPHNTSSHPRNESNCPFCLMILDENVTQAIWEEHVLEDIEPFMCTYGGCSQSYRTYSSREDWQHHEESVHRIATVWICHDCDETLTSTDAFQNHLRSAHKGSFPEQHLQAITKMCKTIRANENARQHCILCGAIMSTKAGEFDHLAAHLIDLALLVFPGAQTVNEMDDSTSEIYEEPHGIEGLGWFKEFGRDDVIPLEHVHFLGMGAFSTVEARKCTSGPTAGTIYACKIFRLIRRNRGIQRENIQAEVAILRRLRHVHIISIVGAYVERNRITLVESPVFDFDLDQYLDLVRDAKQTIKAKWFGCLASALTYLHATQVRHKDLKPRNIGIKNGSVTLSGFAISTSFDDDDGSDSEGPPMAYTRRYASPETLEFEPRSRSSDIFSLGCIFFEMLMPFYKEDPAFRMMEEFQDHHTPYGKMVAELQEIIAQIEQLPSDVQPVARICSSMLARERHARPSAQQVLDVLKAHNLIGKCVSSSASVEYEARDTASVHTLR